MGQKKKMKSFDKKLKKTANKSMLALYSQYDKMADPSKSYTDQQIKRVQQDVAAQKKDADENLRLTQQQADDKQRLSEGQGMRSYQDFINSTQEQMEDAREGAMQDAQEARAAGAGDVFSMMTQQGMGGLAGTGGRARKMLASRAKNTMAKVNLGLKQTLEASQQAIASKDITRMQDVESGRMSMQQAKDTAAQSFTQQTSALDRQLANETSKLQNEKMSGLDRLRMEALGIISSTQASFQHSSSQFKPDFAGDGTEPHTTMDKIDAKYGITGTMGGGSSAETIDDLNI